MSKMRACLPFATLLILALPGLASPCEAASFDCSKAKSKLEKKVCADPVLNKADENLARVYKARLQDFPVPEFIRNSQRAWLSSVPACLPDVATCRKQYQERIDSLTAFAAPKLYTDYGKDFDHERVTLIVTTRNGELWLDWFGAWMPDAYRPKPFPDGYLALDSGKLVKAGDHYTLEDHDDASIVIAEDKITFGGDGMSLSARQGSIRGAFARVR